MSECPKCGYVFAPFETACPRCRREAMAPPEDLPPRVAEDYLDIEHRLRDERWEKAGRGLLAGLWWGGLLRFAGNGLPVLPVLLLAPAALRENGAAILLTAAQATLVGAGHGAVVGAAQVLSPGWGPPAGAAIGVLVRIAENLATAGRVNWPALIGAAISGYLLGAIVVWGISRRVKEAAEK